MEIPRYRSRGRSRTNGRIIQQLTCKRKIGCMQIDTQKKLIQNSDPKQRINQEVVQFKIQSLFEYYETWSWIIICMQGGVSLFCNTQKKSIFNVAVFDWDFVLVASGAYIGCEYKEIQLSGLGKDCEILYDSILVLISECIKYRLSFFSESP